MKKFIFGIVLGVILVSLSWFLYSRGESIILNEKIILERITEQYFTVTNTLFLEEEADLIFDKGSDWSNFLWGKSINARGLVRVDLGVDMSKIKEDSIKVNNINKTIEIIVPEAEILDASIFGDIKFDSEEGILQKILLDTQNEDYNKAVNTLTDLAKKEALSNIQKLTESREKSLSLLELILDNLGYKIIYK